MICACLNHFCRDDHAAFLLMNIDFRNRFIIIFKVFNGSLFTFQAWRLVGTRRSFRARRTRVFVKLLVSARGIRLVYRSPLPVLVRRATITVPRWIRRSTESVPESTRRTARYVAKHLYVSELLFMMITLKPKGLWKIMNTNDRTDFWIEIKRS